MQFDIFEHSRDVMLRNDVVHALERRDGAAAHVAWETLAREYPADESLRALLALIMAIEGHGQPTFRDHDALHHALLALQDNILPAALRIFGDKAANTWLGPLWRELAQRAASLAFRADHGEAHAAPSWLRAGDWKAAAEAAERIESWRRIPAPLAWMAQARLQMYGLQATWGMLAKLAWLSPRRLDELVRRAKRPVVAAVDPQVRGEFRGRRRSERSGLVSGLATDRASRPGRRIGLGAAVTAQRPGKSHARAGRTARP